MTTLKLGCCLFINNEMIEYICDNCRNVEELDLQSCQNIGKFMSISKLDNLKNLNIYRTKCNKDDLKVIIESCKKLEYLNVGSCTEIQYTSFISNLFKPLKNK